MEKHTEQRRQKELRIQKRIIQTDSTIQDLEDMIHADLSYNVPITYYYSGSKSATTLFGYYKDKFHADDIWYNTHHWKHGASQPVHYINTIDGHSHNTGCLNPPLNPLLDNPATNILAETSDKFVAILNIVKQQNARIEEFERLFPVMRKRIIELERFIYDRDDSVAEDRVNEETNDELTSEGESDAEAESLRPVCIPSYLGWIAEMHREGSEKQ